LNEEDTTAQQNAWTDGASMGDLMEDRWGIDRDSDNQTNVGSDGEMEYIMGIFRTLTSTFIL